MEARDGVEALEVLNRRSIDALISDIFMPGMDGYRLCREIRKSANANAGMAIVLYTATYSSGVRLPTRRHGRSGFLLIKPAPIADIISAVNEARKKSRHRQQSSAVMFDDSYVLEQYNVALVHKLEHRNNESA